MSEETLSPSQVHNLLAEKPRRYVLYALYQFTNPIALSDIAGQIVKWEVSVPEDELLDKRSNIYTSLYHIHIPKLEDADVVSYNQTEDRVKLDQNASRLRPYLERAIEIDLDTAELSLSSGTHA